MIRIVTPQHVLLAEVENSAVESFLNANSLAGRKISTRATWTAFDKKIEVALAALKDPATVVIRSGQLNRTRIHTHLMEGKTVFIAPRKREMRHYHTRNGFIYFMDTLARLENPVEIVIPAGQYGDDHVFALRKLGC